LPVEFAAGCCCKLCIKGMNVPLPPRSERGKLLSNNLSQVRFASAERKSFKLQRVLPV
jgi:hypothetical protein